MDKRKLNYYWHKIRNIKTWHLVVITLLFSGLAVYGLRQNSLGLDPRVDAVLATDKEDGDIEAALLDLRGHIFAHMNTALPRPIQLEHSYSRAVEQAYRDAEGSLHTNLYDEAADTCAALSVIVSAGPQCIQDYIDKNWTPDRGDLFVDLPDVSNFTYDFASPKWSPDLAGWSIIIASFSALLIVVRLLAQKMIKTILREHQ